MSGTLNSRPDKSVQPIKLSQNENAFGPSPLALKAIEQHVPSVFRYPDVFYQELRQKLADRHGVTPEWIVISAGSVALMDMSIKALVNFDENIIVPEVSFEGYKYMARVNRRTCYQTKLIRNAISLHNILSKCDEQTRLVFLANPNNPTGTMITHDELTVFLQSISSRVFVVSDEAYVEYVTDPLYPDTLRLLHDFPNLIIFRTFSKIYGLAGLRIGYAIAHPNVINSLRQSWTPFSVNGLALEAALAALDDQEYIQKCARVNAQERMFLYQELYNLGFHVVEPKGNFILVEFYQLAEKEKFSQIMNDAGIIIRPLDRFGMDLGLRITVGQPHENRALINCLKEADLRG